MRLCNGPRIAFLGALLLLSHPLLAQEQQRPGHVGESAVGEVGQRQTGARTQIRTEPMARISSRVPNRVQNRIRNRIDRHYNPQANAASPFEVAADQVENTNLPTRR